MATPSPARQLHGSSGLSIVIAILLILAGLAAIFLPFVAGIAASIAVAWLLLFAGVIHLFFGWHTRSAGAVIWKILVGLAYLVAGIYILGHPGRGLLTLTLILAFYLFFEGIFEGRDLRAAPPPSRGGMVPLRRNRHHRAGHHDPDVLAGQLGVGSWHADRHQHPVQWNHAPQLRFRRTTRTGVAAAA